MPAFKDPTKDKVILPSDGTFEIDVNCQKIFAVVGGSKYEVGGTLTYLIENK